MMGSEFGARLRYLRKRCNLTQKELAARGSVSPRHLSFLETGRANPSRQMVRALANVLGLHGLEREALLRSAGFAEISGEPALEEAIEALCHANASVPMTIHGSGWQASHTDSLKLGLSRLLAHEHWQCEDVSLIRLLFDPELLRPHVVNWAEVAEFEIKEMQRARHVSGCRDESVTELIDQLFEHPGVPARWRQWWDVNPWQVTPVHLRNDRYEIRLLTVPMRLPQEVFGDLHLDRFIPQDAASKEQFEDLIALG